MKVSEKRLEDKKIYESIPLAERSNFRQKIVDTKQIPGDQPKFFIKNFPHNAKFDYENLKLHYHFN